MDGSSTTLLAMRSDTTRPVGGASPAPLVLSRVMQVRITQRYEVQEGFDLDQAAGELRHHSESVNELTTVTQEQVGGGAVHFVFEGFSTAEPDAGHRASNNRNAAKDLGLMIVGEVIEILEFPEQRPATWP